MSKVSAIIINYNTPDSTLKAIAAFRASSGDFDREVILIENGSAAPVPAERAAAAGATVIVNKDNLGFARAVNQGAKLATGDHLLLLNSDVFMETDAVSRLMAVSKEDPRAAIAAPRLVYPDGRTQASFGRWPTLGRELMRFSMLSKILPGGTVVFRHPLTERLFRRPSAVDWASGACLLIPARIWHELGGFDEGYFFGVEDWDLCFRAKRSGHSAVYVPDARAVHIHGGSSGGRRSTWSLRHEGRGADRFLGKFFPEKRIMRFVVKYLYRVKAGVLDIVINLKFKSQNSK